MYIIESKYWEMSGQTGKEYTVPQEGLKTKDGP